MCVVLKVHTLMHEWLSGGVSPCQGEGRGFESRLVLFIGVWLSLARALDLGSRGRRFESCHPDFAGVVQW